MRDFNNGHAAHKPYTLKDRGVLHWHPTLACPHPDDSCVLRFVWLASFVATGELPSLRDFFLVQLFLHPLPFPAVSSPPPFPSLLVLSLSVCLRLLCLCPVARRLVRLVFPVLSTCFFVRSKEKIFFSTLLSVLFALLLSSFCSFMSSWRNRNSWFFLTRSLAVVMMTSTSGFPSSISQRLSINARKSQSYRCSLCV